MMIDDCWSGAEDMILLSVTGKEPIATNLWSGVDANVLKQV
jgi:hypothetical protein